MTDLPIRLNFFRKLELYQDIKFEDKKAAGTEIKDWGKMKHILKWTARGHHHLESYIGYDYAYRNVFEDEWVRKKNELPKNFTEDMILANVKTEVGPLDTIFGNLRQKGYAETESYQNKDQIRFTQLGLEMGRVLFDCEESSFWGRNKYPFFYWTTWITVIASVVLIICNAIIGFVNLLKLL